MENFLSKLWLLEGKTFFSTNGSEPIYSCLKLFFFFSLLLYIFQVYSINN